MSAWETFGAELAGFLASLPSGAKLILAAEGNRFAQFAQADTQLDAELTSNFFLADGWKMSADAEFDLRAAGWLPPTGRTSIGNWHRSLSWPASAAEYEALAEAVVAGMVNALHIAGPAELSAAGWVDGPGELDLTRLGLAEATQ